MFMRSARTVADKIVQLLADVELAHASFHNGLGLALMIQVCGHAQVFVGYTSPSLKHFLLLLPFPYLAQF